MKALWYLEFGELTEFFCSWEDLCSLKGKKKQNWVAAFCCISALKSQINLQYQQMLKQTNKQTSDLQRYRGPVAGQLSSPGCSLQSSKAPWAHASVRSFHKPWRTASACKNMQTRTNTYTHRLMRCTDIERAAVRQPSNWCWYCWNLLTTPV